MKLRTGPINREKLWFLQFLRGIACLLIVYVHWITFLIDPNSLSNIIFQSPLTHYDAPTLLLDFLPIVGKTVPINFREVFYGLGLFFLISGFVIPLSLEKDTKVNFLIRRISRILPTAMICIFIISLAIIVCRFIEGVTTLPFQIKTIMSSAFLIRDILGQPYIENAIWTLEIEVHFYIICFCLAFFSGHKKAYAIVITSLTFLSISILLKNNLGVFEILRTKLELLAMNGCFLLPMFIGMALFNFKYNNWSIQKTFFILTALMTINNYTLQNYYPEIAAIIYTNHIYATLTFIVFLLLGEKIPHINFIDKVAEISYPLYLLHGTMGYVIFYAAFKASNNVTFATAVASTLICTLSILIHLTVELPSIKFGKWVAALATNSPPSSAKKIRIITPVKPIDKDNQPGPGW